VPELAQSLRQFPSSPQTQNAAQSQSAPTTAPLWDIPFLIGVSVGEAPLASSANSLSEVLNCEEPQSMHTKTLGNTRIPGLSRFLRPRKWRFTSATNSAWRPDAHDGQLMATPSPATLDTGRRSVCSKLNTRGRSAARVSRWNKHRISGRKRRLVSLTSFWPKVSAIRRSLFRSPLRRQ